VSTKAVDLAARAIRHVGWRWVRSSALLAACLVALSPGQGAADPDQALLRCIARHGQAALKACDEASGSDLGPAERAAPYYHKGLELGGATQSPGGMPIPGRNIRAARLRA
jgi:hypothetical protein